MSLIVVTESGCTGRSRVQRTAQAAFQRIATGRVTINSTHVRLSQFGMDVHGDYPKLFFYFLPACTRQTCYNDGEPLIPCIVV